MGSDSLIEQFLAHFEYQGTNDIFSEMFLPFWKFVKAQVKEVLNMYSELQHIYTCVPCLFKEEKILFIMHVYMEKKEWKMSLK